MNVLTSLLTSNPDTTVCDDCLPDDSLGPMRGICTGIPPLTVCRKCGTVVEGIPSISDEVYKQATGTYPWVDNHA